MSKDSMEKQNPSLYKRKSPIETSQIPNSKKAKINPDESLAELKKKATDFNVGRAVFWEKGERVPFMFVAKALNAISEDAISKDSGLIVITEILCNMLRTVIETTPNDLVAVMYLLSESIVPLQPTYLCIEFAQYTLAIANACSAEVKDIENDLKELGHFGDFGDLSLVAQARLSSSTPGCFLTAVQVYETFKELELAMGNNRHIIPESIKSLLVKATGCEPLCLIHMLQRLQSLRLRSVKLRLEEQTLLTALGHAALYSKNPNVDPLELEEAAKVVKEVYSIVPIYDNLVPDLLRVGVWKLRETCIIAPGIPFQGMIHKQTIESLADILDKFQDREFICEYKYLGNRAMIHYSEEGKMEVFCTMTGRRITDCYQGAGLEAVRLKHHSVTSFIIDCQFVEENIQTQKEPIKACMYALDMLYLNGELLLQEQLKVRLEHLHRSFQEQTGALQFSVSSTSTDPLAIEKLYNEAVNSGCPGLLFKTLTKDATYKPATPSENWLVLSKDDLEYIPSLNLVPIAALHREHHQPGDDVTFLLACYDSYEKEFRTLCTMSARDGTPEEILEERYEILRSNRISNEKPTYSYEYPEGMEPEWFEPTEVWEVRFVDLYEDADERFTLVHPHFVRELANKSPTQASSVDEVVELSGELMERYNYVSDEEDLPEEDLSNEDYNSSLDEVV